MENQEQYISKPWSLDTKHILHSLHTDRHHGLASSEIKQKKLKFGLNEIKQEHVQSSWMLFLKQFNNPMGFMLLIASSVSFFVGETLDAMAILLILFINSFIGYFQENKSIRAMDELKKLSSPKVRIIRNGSHGLISSKDIVPGDIIQVEAGDLVSADSRILNSSQLSVDEASLTGESLPVRKKDLILPAETSMADRINMLHSGTAISTGSAHAVVTSTGMATEMGAIAGLLGQQKKNKTPLEIKLEKVTKNLIYLGLLVIFAVVIIRYREGDSALDIVMASISLAVAAIPEGLPTVVSLALMLAVHRMTKRNAIVRNLSSVEALGSADVICSDKTGTLTTGVMTASEHFLLLGKDEATLFKVLVLCNNAAVAGDTTEVALLRYVEAFGIKPMEMRQQFKRLHEWSFESDRKRMSVLVEDENQHKWIFVKGAPESMISQACNPKEELSLLHEKISEYSSKGYRLLVAGYKEGIASNQEEAESHLTILGIIVISDPPRKETIPAIKECQEAGIRVLMITGDHALTAKAIAADLGILRDENDLVMTGKELDEIEDTELVKRVEHVAVFARVTPTHKLKIIQALKKNGHFVAMTGDGVNDAPALRMADIGISMGKGGTEVARKASGIILADDNFSTIVSAVEEGRAVYSNIRQTVRYLLSTNLAEILIVLGASLIGFQVPFNPMGLLWINLITDGLPSLALASEPLDRNVLGGSESPNPDTFFDKKFTIELFLMGLLITVIGLGTYIYLVGKGDREYARSCAFTLLVFMSLSLSLTCRNESKTFFELKPNVFLLISVFLSVGSHVLLQQTELFQKVFDVQSLPFNEIIYLFFLSLIPATFSEVYKLLTRRKV